MSQDLVPVISNLKKVKLYDNSRISNFKRCPRYYLYRDIYDWTPDRKAIPLVFGSGWHAGMDVIWRRHKDGKDQFNSIVEEAMVAFLGEWTHAGLPPPDEMSPDDIDEYLPRTPMVAEEMFYNYLEERQHIFKHPSFELLEIEQPFAVPLGPVDDSLWYVGRIDKTFRYNKRIIFGEHKTSTAYKKDGPFRAEFIDGFNPNSQIDGYQYRGHMEYGKEFGGVWVDAALVHKTVHDGFQIIPIEKQFSQIDAWLWETHNWIDQIELNKSVLKDRGDLDIPYLAAFSKNTGSCGNYGGCGFADLCRTVSNPAKLHDVPLGYKFEHWSPFDEIKLEKLGFTPDKGD